jgi:HEAT repeat protein
MIMGGNMNQSKNDIDNSTDSVKSLIAELGSKDRKIRMNAHKSLVEKAESVVRPLVEAMSSPSERVRWEAGRILDEIDVPWRHHADAATVSFLIRDLGSKDGLVRVRARRALVTIGSKAVAALKVALTSKNASTRWEAAKALGQIGDAEATAALIMSLEDEMFEVRWLVAEALIAIGRPALVPLLRKLTEKPDLLWLREGAHHVLHGINTENIEEILLPVRNALEDIEAPLEVPFAAEAALKSLTKVPPGRLKRISK